VKTRLLSFALFGFALVSTGCAPIEYSVVIVQASQSIAEAEIAGAACTQEQLDKLSPMTENTAPDPGYALASSEEEPAIPKIGQPTCDAPYEYYSAVEYLKKAREEVSYSDYEAAMDFATEALTSARSARDIALNRDQETGW
jgi:hypothetical protein